MNIARVSYGGTALPGNAEVVDLFNSVTAQMTAGMASYCAKRFILHLKNDQSGTLRLYSSNDGGTTWIQQTEDAVAAATDTDIQQYNYVIAPFKDIKLEWTNGATVQGEFGVDMVIDSEIGPTV